jgi:nucleoside phosphorylase
MSYSNEQAAVASEARILKQHAKYRRQLTTFSKIIASEASLEDKRAQFYKLLGGAVEFANICEQSIGDANLLGATKNQAWAKNKAETSVAALETILKSYLTLVAVAEQLSVSSDSIQPSSMAYASLQRHVALFFPGRVDELRAQYERAGLPVVGFDDAAPLSSARKEARSLLAEWRPVMRESRERAKAHPGHGITADSLATQLLKLEAEGARLITLHAPWLSERWARCGSRQQPGFHDESGMIPRDVSVASIAAELTERVAMLELLEDAISKNDATPAVGSGRTSARGETSAKRAKIDVGILTIRNDEFNAVLDAFPNEAGSRDGAHRVYTLRYADAGNDEQYTIAILRQNEQGNGEAQEAARDLIGDLAPRLVLVVGIAGGFPSDDLKLGDVVISTRIQDFTVEARKVKAQPTYASSGGPITKALAARVTNLAARKNDLGDWAAKLPPQPGVNWTRKGQIYGSPQWQRDLKAKLNRHYRNGAPPRPPIYAAGTIASSDKLLKDARIVIPWLTTSRDILAVEMEAGGVYRAARERCPMLAIRGISDIVGLKRADDWTKYACVSVAAFTCAFLRTRPVACRKPRR